MDVPDATHFAEPAAAIAPLKVMTETTATRFFNDSCAESELRYAIERGATGATTVPPAPPAPGSVPPAAPTRSSA